MIPLGDRQTDTLIFGIPAADLPGEYDLELTYNETTKRYHLGIETIYQFEDYRSAANYYYSLWDAFHDWMAANNYDTGYCLAEKDIYECESRNEAEWDCASIPEAYAWFSLMMRISYPCR